MILAAQVLPNYTFDRALADLSQVSPVVIVIGALLLAMVIDLILPRAASTIAVPVVAVLGLLGALAAAALLWHSGTGGTAYYGYATGDAFATFFEILFAVLGVLTVGISVPYLRARGFMVAEFQILTLAAVAGMMALAAANSLVTVFLSLELFSVSLYIMSGFARRETTSQEAAAKYLLVGGFASAFLLYGMALLYGATGSTLLPVISQRLGDTPLANPILLLGVVLLGVGFGFKVSAAPFHMWTPDVYQGAPLPVTAFMSVGTKAAAFAMIIRVFATGLPHLGSEWTAILAFVAAVSMVWGNLLAIVQSSVKRLLAYSGIAQAGYVLVGVAAGGRSGIGAVLFYLFAYMFMNFGAFAVLTYLAGPDSDRDRISNLDGLGYKHPFLGVLMTVFMLSLAGFPPSVGFIGKFFLFTAGVGAGFTWLVVLAVLMSVVSVFYYLRVVIHVWTPVPEVERRPQRVGALLAIGVSAVLSIALGIAPAYLFGLGGLGAQVVEAASR